MPGFPSPFELVRACDQSVVQAALISRAATGDSWLYDDERQFLLGLLDGDAHAELSALLWQETLRDAESLAQADAAAQARAAQG